MEFTEPHINGFTIYSKSGCYNCSKIKKILSEKQLFFLEIQCDEYLIEDRSSFISFIENKSNKIFTCFPVVFYDGKFIGGYNEAIEYIEKLLLSFEELF